MEKNNGKIAIAIVAMFVVALSVVGFTYAYFVATVNNNKTDEKITVQAGTLKVAYGNGQTLTAKNIVPGWKSDGDMVYNSIASVSTEEVEVEGKKVNETRITAVSFKGLTEDQKTKGTTTEVVNPVTFTVKDESTKNATAYYGIRLKGVTNELYATEPNNFLVTLTGTDGTKIENYKLTDATTQILSQPISITGSETVTYTLSAEYVEANAKQTGTDKDVAFTVEVVGLQLVGTKYVDALGNEWK